MAGTPQIEVTFDIDVNGIVNVSAKDLGTGNLQSITITSNSNMSEEEIERARWEARVYEKQDNEAGELVQLVIDAGNLANRINAELAAHKKDWDKPMRKQIKDAAGALHKALNGVKPENVTIDEADKIAAAKNNLEQLLNQFNIAY